MSSKFLNQFKDSKQGNSKTPCYNDLVNEEVLYNMEAVHTKIKSLRKELGLTQKELAEKIGVHPAQLAKYEIGLSTPSLGVLVKLAKYCEVSIDYIVFGHDREMSKRSKLQDQELLDLARRIDRLNRPKRDKLKWAIQSLLANQP